MFQSKGRCAKGGPKVYRKNPTLDVVVSSNSHSHPLLSFGHRAG